MKNEKSFRTAILRICAIATILFATSLTVSAQQGGRRGAVTGDAQASWEVAKRIQSELTAEQKATIKEKMAANQATLAQRGLRRGTSGQRGISRIRTGRAQNRFGGPLNDILTQEQKDRLRTDMMENGPAADRKRAQDEAMAQALGLNANQTGTLQRIRTENQAEMQALRAEAKTGGMSPNALREKTTALQAKHKSAMESVFTPAQLELIAIHQMVTGSARRGAIRSNGSRNMRGTRDNRQMRSGSRSNSRGGRSTGRGNRGGRRF